VDIDVLLFDEDTLEGPQMVLPHPGVARAFNLGGSRISTPGWVYIPERGTVRAILAGAKLGDVREFGEVLRPC
jgi:2-amino-4-hydroxy-6-hydroxymethyldihydropteridine diphosphokinase